MLTKRIIPCLDVKDGMTVKGVQFVNFREAGDPVALGKQYSAMGADDLVYLDITASHEGRKTFTDLVGKIAAEVNIPFTVGGGINALEDVERLLGAGADKVSVNSAAIRHPELITQIATRFGAQECVVAIDAHEEADGTWRCYLNGGRVPTDRTLFEWAHEAQERGAGEILFTSMNHDGSKHGYANAALRRLHDELSIPVIASGGAGCREHFRDVFVEGHADAALAASVFHFGEIPMRELKEYLRDEGIPMRVV
jgi:cyclase